MLPIEMKVPTHRRNVFEPQLNHKLLEESLDLIEEMRARSQLINALYQQRMTRYFNKKIRDKQFAVEDLVLRHVFLSTRDLGAACSGLIGKVYMKLRL